MHKGIRLAFLTACISGFAIFINKFGVSFWLDSSAYTTAKNIVAALFLFSVLVAAKKLPELKHLSRALWTKLILIGFVGGSIPFLLFFKSLTLISAPEAAFIHKTLFLWVALLAYPILKERLGAPQILGLAVLVWGIIFLGTPGDGKLNAGAMMAFGATVLWAIENIIAKITLKEVSSITVGWARMFFGSLFLIAYLTLWGNIGGLIPSSVSQAGWALLVGATLFLYVTTWYAALKHAPATVVSAVLVIAAPITAALSAITAHTFPQNVIVPFVVMGIGVLLISQPFERIIARLLRKKETAYA